MWFWGLLGGSWVVISRVTSPLIGLITMVSLLVTTPEPPSTGFKGVRVQDLQSQL